MLEAEDKGNGISARGRSDARRVVQLQMPRRRSITAGPMGQTARHTAYRGHAYTREIVDVPIGAARQQQGNDPPAIGLRFQLGRRAQVIQKRRDIGWVTQSGQRLAQRTHRVGGRLYDRNRLALTRAAYGLAF